MRNANIGVANLMVSKRLNESIFDNNSLDESQNIAGDFFEVVKNSPILQLEFKVFNNLENKTIENDMIATRYIDNNIKLFEVYTLDEIEKEHAKLAPFVSMYEPYEDSKVNLYESISTLIKESLNDYNSINVDSIHESFTTVLNHIKSPKKQVVSESENKEIVNEEVIEIAIEKFNEKYDTLAEDDKKLLKQLFESDNNQKLELLESYKKENLLILEGYSNGENNEGVERAIRKINEMSYKINSNEFLEKIDDDIISLHELKKGLI